MIDLTPIFEAILALLAALVTYKLIPWIKARTTAEQQSLLAATVKTLVYAAEQLYGAGKGAEKLDYVISELEKRGFTADRAAIEAAGPGQVLVPSFQGSRVEGMSEEEYIADHATTARLVKETGAKLMVMNTSCPNEGHNRLLCHNPLLVGRITEAVKQEIGDIPLMVKLAYIPSDGDLELMVRSTVGHGTVQGFSTINTISAKLVDANGNQALPGAGRDRSGVCGNAIRGAGLDMVARLAAIREKLGLDFKINGVGGVVSPADYQAYRNAGADSVMSATGAMWDAELAHKIKASR